MTRYYKRLFWFWSFFSILLNIGPVFYYVIKSYLESDLTHEKVALSMIVMVVLIMTAITIINKHALRSRIWLLLIGMYLCLDNIIEPLIVIASCQVFDEIIASPSRENVRQKLTINKQIDLRG